MNGPRNSKKEPAKTSILLDTKPIIKLFAKEEGWEEVRKIMSAIERAEIQAAISVLSFTEIYYKYVREKRPDLAEARTNNLGNATYLRKIGIDERIATKAGKFKGEYSISVVDAIIASSAYVSNSLIISDDPDFKKIGEVETLTEEQYVAHHRL